MTVESGPLSHAGPEVDEPTALALGVRPDAVRICRTADLIDLHIDTFIPPRIWGYDLMRRHKRGPLGGWFFGHLDLPRIEAAGMTGAMWSITTNPFRRPGARWRVFQRNLARFDRFVAAAGDRLTCVTTPAEYHAAQTAGAHAVLLSIQGGNALQAAPFDALDTPMAPGQHPLGQRLTRVTLVHLTNACYGATSAPFHHLRRDKGLTEAGRRLIQRLNAHRIFVDLAHAHRDTFWQATEVHAPDLPLIATHTGVNGVRQIWRNLDDDQIKVIADSGGVIGVIFAAQFLARRGGPRDADMVIEHLEHIMTVGGDHTAALGSDYDGAITPPRDLRSGDALPRLVERMLVRGWSEAQIRGVLGTNFLGSWAGLRAPAAQPQ